MKKEKKLVIIGTGEFALLAYEYFEDDSEYSVMAFCVEDKYYSTNEYEGRPVCKLDELDNLYPADEYEVFVAITYVHLNKERERICKLLKNLKYHLASYVSSATFTGKGITIGENVFVFDSCSLQHYVEIGDGTVIWNGSVVAHRSKIGNYSWIAPSTVIPGLCTIGDNCFIGCNSTFVDSISIKNKVIIGAGSVVTSACEEETILVGNPARKLGKEHWDKFYEE